MDSDKSSSFSKGKSGPGETGRVLDFPFSLSEIAATADEDQAQGYAPLPFGHLPEDGPAPFDIYLKIKLKSSPEPRFVLCCPQGQVFPQEWRQKLQQVKISNLYFPVAEVNAVLGHLERRLKEDMESPRRSVLEKAIVSYEVLEVWTRNFFASPQDRADVELNLSLKCIDGLLHLIGQEKVHLGFIFEIRRHDRDRYTHSLNVCLLGLAFVSHLHWDADKARAFGLGALLHDIGLTQVPAEVLKKKGALTADERESVEKHPARGYRILKNFGSISNDALTLVLQHHENGDGSGYPQKMQLADIHPWARILRIVDSFEAMTEDRPWRLARPPRETLQAMCDDWHQSQIYDPVYLKAFIKFLGTL
ncbi:MAG: HD domain-containing protein [Deltaproteobacteria bacterium]|nr:MAG: HD domain-containing protein [Deltaproteobacteria bacterium]